jgi:DNA polymerase II large subunit
MGGQFSMGSMPEELEVMSRFAKLEHCHRKYLKIIRQRRADDPGHFIRYPIRIL